MATPANPRYSGWRKNRGSGKAISRILSSWQNAGERIICLSSQYPGPVPRWRPREAGSFEVPYLALHPMGFSMPCRSRGRRWALTPPFHPYYRVQAVRLELNSGIFSVALSVWTPRDVAARVYLVELSCVCSGQLRGIAPSGVRTFLPHPADKIRG